MYHAGSRALSDSKINFNEKIIVRGSSLPLLTQIHGKIQLLSKLSAVEYGRQKPSKVPFLNEIDKIEMN